MSNVESLPSVRGNIEDVLEYNRQNNWPDIDPQAKVFCHEYAIAGNLTKACKAIGVGREKGMRLYRDQLVYAFIEHLQKDLHDHTIITRQFVELKILETWDKVNGDVDVPNVTKDGDIVMAPRYNATGATAMIKEMRSLAGMNKEVGVDGHGVTVNINVDGFVGNTGEKEVNVVVDQPPE